MEPSEPPGESVLFSYFLVRLRRTAAGLEGHLAGLVERMGTGEKRSFTSADELLALVSGWTAAAASIEETCVIGHPAEGPGEPGGVPSTPPNPQPRSS